MDKTDFYINMHPKSKYCPNCGAKMDGGISDEPIHDKK